MRSYQLQTAITEFFDEAASHLQVEVDAGAEVAFEIDRGGFSSARTPLYCYQPLTRKFIAERWRALSALASYRRAAVALEGFAGLQRYISIVGAPSSLDGSSTYDHSSPPRGDAEVALWVMLGEVFDEQTEFELRPERVQSTLDRLERAALGSPEGTALVATLHGMTIASDELVLTGGVRLVAAAAGADLPEDVLPVDGQERADHLVVVLTSGHDTAEAAAASGRAVLRDLLGSLRLFGDGRVELGELVWVRIDDGRWRPLALAAAAQRQGMLVVTPDQEDELRAFCNLISRRTPTANAPAWALGRFQMGCGREHDLEALSDYLSALRALLEPEGSPRGALAGRLAALCAVPSERAQLADLVTRALALERDVVEGNATADVTSTKLVRTIADHLRALLRDVICGHLDYDLATLADKLLVAESPRERARADTDGPPPRITAARGPRAGWNAEEVWLEGDELALSAAAGGHATETDAEQQRLLRTLG
jgi:hypothetical protein